MALNASWRPISPRSARKLAGTGSWTGRALLSASATHSPYSQPAIPDASVVG